MNMRKRRVVEIGHDGVWMQPLEPAVPYAGAYVLGEDECWIWLQRRPTWWQRWCVTWLLGWRWVDLGAGGAGADGGTGPGHARVVADW